MMDCKQLELSKWIPVGCVLEQKGQELWAQPGDDGFIRLRLEGPAGEVAGLPWGEHRYFVVEMLADMDSQALVDFAFEQQNADPTLPRGCLNYELIPGRWIKFAVDLEDMKSQRYFTTTLPGMLKGRARCVPSDIRETTAVELCFHPGFSHVFKGVSIRQAFLCNNLPDMQVQGAPMVDMFGQWTEKDWSTKTHSKEALSDYLRAEYTRAETDGSYPEGWSQYGGWTGLRFPATGYFYAKKHGGRWWLADPEGYAFISNGMCYGSRMGVHGFTDKMENLFAWLPDPSDETYKDAWTTADQIAEFVKRNGIEAGKNRRMFNFARANMIRVFGADGWWDAWVKINAARMKRWGFNTIGVGVNNYNDERVGDFLKDAKIPYVWTLKDFPLTDELIFRDFPDVFSEQYQARSKAFAQQLVPMAEDPYFIGYFVTNEPEWKFQMAVNPAEKAFAHPARLASKSAMIAVLKEKYGEISHLNAAWNQSFASFEDLYTPFAHGDQFSTTAAQDFEALRLLLLEAYAQVPSDALRAVDPNHMNLGLRYNRISENVIAGSEQFQVLSFNCYFPSPASGFEMAAKALDMPCMVGEWHIGGADKGLLSCGLLASATQEERGKACEHYMQQALAQKNCVGIHYFEMNDQPLLGRFDGECMQHGVIDVCNRAYEELTCRFEAVGKDLYRLASGEVLPTAPLVETFRTR